MVFTVPTILESAPNTMGGLGVSDAGGSGIVVKIWQVAGLTSGTYARTLNQVLTGSVVKAKWTHNRMGGAGHGEFVVQGGVLNLDTAIAEEWELEVLRATAAGGVPSTWYRGRIVNFKIALDKRMSRTTTILTEGYAAKLREIVFSATIAAGQTVTQAVQTIMSTYVTPQTRIRFNAADVVGAYALAGALEFKNADALSSVHRLAMLQGSTEWGVTEGGASSDKAPAFYFKADSTAQSETANFIAGNNLEGMTTEGEAAGAYNTVQVVGGFASGSVVTGTYTDATAVSAYGQRFARVNWSPLQHATDANRLAQNYVTFYKDMNGRYSACLMSPAARVEPDRTDDGYGTGTPVIPASPKATFWGDSAKVSALWNSMEYHYEQGCPFVFWVCGFAGLFQPGIDSDLARLTDLVDTYSGHLEQLSSLAPSGASYVVVSLSGVLTAERVLAVNTGNLSLTDGGANGNITINTIQNIATTSEPTFAGLTLGTQELNLQAQTPTILNADVNDYAFAGAASAAGIVYRMDAAGASRTITGFAGGVAGRMIRLYNLGTQGFGIILSDQDNASIPPNRIFTGANFDVTIGPGQWADLWYDVVSAVWRVA